MNRSWITDDGLITALWSWFFCHHWLVPQLHPPSERNYDNDINPLSQLRLQSHCSKEFLCQPKKKWKRHGSVGLLFDRGIIHVAEWKNMERNSFLDDECNRRSLYSPWSPLILLAFARQVSLHWINQWCDLECWVGTGGRSPMSSMDFCSFT